MKRFLVLIPLILLCFSGLATLGTTCGQVSRDEQARRVVRQYLDAEKRGEVGSRQQYWCHPSVVPGAFSHLVDYEIDSNYYSQKHNDPNVLPNWYEFVVNIRATNAFNAVVLSHREYYVRLMPDGTSKLFTTCEDDDCTSFMELYAVAGTHILTPDAQALCGIPK